jgi:NAD(P)-dependent dehydrogenase (short-subunit alcohol dehydrogenase family)
MPDEDDPSQLRGRMAAPDEIAAAVLFLASGERAVPCKIHTGYTYGVSLHREEMYIETPLPL